MIPSASPTRISVAALFCCAGLAVSAEPVTAPSPDRVPDELIREFEIRALVGPVVTDTALPTPINRARLSRVTLFQNNRQTAGGVEALRLIDGDPGSAVELTGNAAVELAFIGAPRWISGVAVDSDAASVAVEYLDVNRKWRPFGQAAGGQRVEGDLVRAMGLRVVPTSAGRAAQAVSVREISAWMKQTDADDGVVYGLGAAVTGEYFYEWCETYASSPLSVCSEECEGLRDELPNDWSKWGFGNSSSWESDFKRSALGGNENSYVDANDLSYFAGHGSASYDSTWNRTSRNLLFSRTDRDDSAHVPGDSYDSWGDLDMEWMCFAACQLMKDDGYWAASMDGQHLILGWHTNMRDVTMGIDFGKHANGTSIFDPAHTVLGSWLHAAEKNHGSGYTAKVVGETTAMGNDYLWGEGFVNPDPVDDTTYTYWTYNTGPGGLIDPGVGDRFANIRLMEQPPEGPALPEAEVHFDDKSPGAVPVSVPERLLNRERGAIPMKIYQLLLPAVQAEYVREIVGQICQQTGLFCQSDIGPSEDKSQYVVTDGAWELRVDVSDGSIQLVDTAQFGVPPEKIPQLPTLNQSVELAMADLSKLGLLPQDAQPVAADSLVQGDLPDTENGGPAPALVPPEPILQRVLFARTVEGFGVAGPRGEMAAHVGPNGLAQVQMHGWNPLQAVGETDTVPLEQVLSDLNKNPTKVAIDGITVVPEGIKIVDAQLGYFPSAAGLLRPAYLILAEITERTGPNVDPQVSMLEINAWADTELPVVQIVGGAECVDYGKDLCFGADVFGGEPPYTFEWSDDVAGVVGTQAEVCFPPEPIQDFNDSAGDQLNAPSPHETGEETRTISVRVTDALGTVFTDAVVLPICSAPCPADLNGDGILDNGDIGTFIQLFLGGNLAADMNGDGILDNGDIGTFIQLFLAGC